MDADLRRAEQAAAAGEIETVLRLGTELAASRRRRALPPDRQAALFLLLAWQSCGVDADDTLTACMAMADRCRQKRGSWNSDVAGRCAQLRLLQWVWSDPAFESLLTRPAFDAARRDLLLSRLLQEAMAMPAAWWEPVVMALLERQAEGACRALAALPVRHQEPEQVELSYLVAAMLFVLGDTAGACAVAGVCHPSPTATEPPRDRPPLQQMPLLHLHLQALLAGARGEPELALSLYRQYATQAAQHIGRLHPLARDLLKTLTSQQVSQPRDLPDVRPPYLEEALALLASGEAPAGVVPLARRVGISERTLREAFRVHLGTSPREHALHLRLDAARRFIDSGLAVGMPVADLALRFGFGHAGRFSGQFRRRFGHSPSTVHPPSKG